MSCRHALGVALAYDRGVRCCEYMDWIHSIHRQPMLPQTLSLLLTSLTFVITDIYQVSHVKQIRVGVKYFLI